MHNYIQLSHEKYIMTMLQATGIPQDVLKIAVFLLLNLLQSETKVKSENVQKVALDFGVYLAFISVLWRLYLAKARERLKCWKYRCGGSKRCFMKQYEFIEISIRNAQVACSSHVSSSTHKPLWHKASRVFFFYVICPHKYNLAFIWRLLCKIQMFFI